MQCSKNYERNSLLTKIFQTYQLLTSYNLVALVSLILVAIPGGVGKNPDQIGCQLYLKKMLASANTNGGDCHL